MQSDEDTISYLQLGLCQHRMGRNLMPINHLNRWIVLLLAALMVLSIALGRQGYRIARTQDAVTDSVLHDYAQLITENYARAIQTQIGFERIYPLVRELGTAGILEIHSKTTDIKRWPATDANALAEDLLGLPLSAAFYLSAQTSNEPVTLLGGDKDAVKQAVDWLTINPGAFSYPFQILHWNNNQQTQVMILAPATNGTEIFGLMLEAAVFTTLIEAINTNHTLLPPALADSDAIRPFVHLQIKDTANNNIFITPNYRYNSTTATQIISGDYAGLFAGYSISATIDREAAPLFAFGAHPRDDLSTIAVLLILTLVLGVAAILLLRREQKLMVMREDFVARVSHELRTPLTQIRMYSESLLFKRLPKQTDQTRALQVIQRETTRLGRLVENILRFSSSNHQQALREKKPYLLQKLLQQLHDDFSPMLTAKQTSLTINCDASITCQCHRESVLQTLGNLLDNALKYGPDGQTIHMHVCQNDDQIHLCLDDQGPGIPARHHQQIFEPYFRLANEQDRAIAGTGIGLSVAMELAKKMAGDIQVESLPERGTRFCLILPAN